MVSLRLNHFLVEQISLVGYWKWDEMTCLRYLGELDGFLHQNQEFLGAENTAGHSTKKTYTPPLAVGELTALWILLSSCCITENMGIFPLQKDSKLSNDFLQNVDPYQVVLDFRYFALFFFLHMRYCLKLSTPLFSRAFPQSQHPVSTVICKLNSFDKSLPRSFNKHKTTTHSFDSTYRPLVLTPRSKSHASLKHSESPLGTSHSTLMNDPKVPLGHEKETLVQPPCTKTEALLDFVMDKLNILLRIVHRHYLSDIHHVIPEHLNVLLLIMTPISNPFDAPSYHLNNFQDILEVFSTRIPETEDVWSPVLVEQYLLRALSFEQEIRKNTNDSKHFSEDCIILEGFQHETKVYCEQQFPKTMVRSATSKKNKSVGNILRSFRSFWLRTIASSQIYIFHSRVKHVRIQNCSHACVLVPAISGILLVMNCHHVEIMTTSRCLKIRDSSYIKVHAFTWTSPIITGTSKNILLGPYNVLFSKQKHYMKLNALWFPSRFLMQWSSPRKLSSRQYDESLETQNTFNRTEQTTDAYQCGLSSKNVPCIVQTKSLTSNSVYSLVSPGMFCPFVMPERHLLFDSSKLLNKYLVMLPEMYSLSLGENQKKVQEQLYKIRQLCADRQQMSGDNMMNILHQSFLKWIERSGYMKELFNVSRFTTTEYFK